MNYKYILKDSWGSQKDNLVTYAIATLIAFIGSVLVITIAPLFYGLMSMAAKGARSEAVEISDVFEGFRNGNFVRSWSFVLVFAVLSSIATYIHPILNTIVSIIFLFGLPLLVIKGYGAIDAIKGTFELVKTNPVESLVLYVITTVLNIVGAILLGVGLLVTAPLSLIILAKATRELV